MTVESVLIELSSRLVSLERKVATMTASGQGGLWTRAAQSVTIDTGEITPESGSLFILTPETGAADDLDTINNNRAGRVVSLRTTSGNTITLKHGTGNISLPGGTDVDIDDTRETYSLVYDDDQSAWIPFSVQASSAAAPPSTPTAVAGRINLGTRQAVTLSTGVFSLVTDKSYYSVTSEAGTSDDLTDINGGSDGDLIVVEPASGHTISALETGNLDLDGSKTLDGANDKLTLIYNNAASKWEQVSWSGN